MLCLELAFVYLASQDIIWEYEFAWFKCIVSMLLIPFCSTQNGWKFSFKLVVGSCFGQYLGLSGNKDLVPPKNYIYWLVDWAWFIAIIMGWLWTNLCAKHEPYNTYTFIHINIYILQSKWLRSSRRIIKNASKDVRDPKKIERYVIILSF